MYKILQKKLFKYENDAFCVEDFYCCSDFLHYGLKMALAWCVSDFLHRLVKVAGLHAGVTPVTYFTLGYILSGHLDEEITCSQCMKTTALPAR